MIDPSALEGGKLALFADLLARSESVAGQALLLGQAELLGGDWRLAGTLLNRACAVTPAEVAAFLNSHARSIQTTVVGPPGHVDERLFTSD